MNGNLLDTNVIVEVLRGEQSAIDFLNSLDDVFIPSVAIGELLYGANKSARTEQNTALIRDLTNGIETLPIDEEIAEIYAEIKHELVSTGFNLPENDLWIAAIAKKHNLTLATFDSHFSHIKSIETAGIKEDSD